MLATDCQKTPGRFHRLTDADSPRDLDLGGSRASLEANGGRRIEQVETVVGSIDSQRLAEIARTAGQIGRPTPSPLHDV